MNFLKTVSVLFLSFALFSCGNTPKSRLPVDLSPLKKKENVGAELIWSVDLANLNFPEKNNILAQNSEFIFVSINDRTYKISKSQGKITAQKKHDFNVVFGNLIDENLLYVLGSSGQIKAISINDFSDVWQIQTHSFFASYLQDDTQSIYARLRNGLTLKLDKKDGSTIWEYKLAQNNQLSIENKNEAVLSNSKLVLTTDDGKLLIFNQRDLYKTLKSEPQQLRLAYPVGMNKTDELINMKITTNDNFAYISVFNNEVFKLDLNRLETIFKTKVSSLYKPVVFKDQIIVNDFQSSIVSLDKNTGKTIWKMNDLNYRITAPLLKINELILAFDLEGFIHLINPNNAEGSKIVARFRNKSNKIQTEALVDSNSENELYYLDNDGILSKVKIAY